MSDFDRDLEHELRAGAPQARPLFVDDVARRLHAQRPGLRPNRLRLSLALAFSALTVVALGVLGAPAYVAHAADALVQTATTTFSGGSGPSTNVLSGGAASSGSFQYETPEPICHRTNTDPVNRTYVLIVDSPSNHFGHPDIIPAPPWGCPPSHSPGRPGDPSETTTTLKATNDGPGFLAGQKKFNLAVTAADGSTPQGFILCFDNLSPFDQTVLIDGKATCTYGMRAVGTHNITAVFHTGDVRKWASSAGNVLTITVGKASSSVSVQTSRTPAPSGAVVVFTATVTGASGFSTPTGSVQFSDGSTALGSPVPLSTAGVAQLSSSSLAIGTHTMKATYVGDALYDAQSATVSQTIATAPVPPRPAVLPSPPPSLEPPAHADAEPSAATSQDQTQQPAPSTAQAPP